MPKPMPVSTVKSGCANGDITTRTKKVAAVTEAMPLPPVSWSVPNAVPRYRMFSVKAKPVAVTPAITTPSTMPVKSRLRNRKTRRTAAALADSSTTGAITVAPRVSALAGSAVAVAIHLVAKLLATIAISAAAQAPQEKQNSRLRQGPGSTRSSQRKAATSSGTGSTARPSPTRNPWVPVCSRTRARITRPESASSVISAPYRTQDRCHQCGCVRGNVG